MCHKILKKLSPSPRQRKTYVMNRTLVRRRYSWSAALFFDVLAAVSWDMIFHGILVCLTMLGLYDITDTSSAINIININWYLNLLHSFKMFRMIKVKSYFDKIIDILSKQLSVSGLGATIRFVKLIFVIFFSTHLSGMLQWTIPKSYGYPQWTQMA